MMTTVSKAHALKTNEARIRCIAGGKNCGAEMARQPARVSAIKTGMAKPEYRVRVELIEIREFLERYPGKIFFFFPPFPRWSRCTYMVKPPRLILSVQRKTKSQTSSSLLKREKAFSPKVLELRQLRYHVKPRTKDADLFHSSS